MKIKNSEVKIFGVKTDEVLNLHDFVTPHLDAHNISYYFEHIDLSDDGPSYFNTYKYGLCLYMRCLRYLKFLQSLKEGEVILFSDLDVMPLQNYDCLLKYLDNANICFMQEDPRNNLTVNCGFILVRKSVESISLFELWKEKCERIFLKENYLFDQSVMQDILDSGFCSYMTFPHSVVSRRPDLIYAESVAYHAINVGVKDKSGFRVDKDNSYKIKAMKKSLNRFLSIK